VYRSKVIKLIYILLLSAGFLAGCKPKADTGKEIATVDNSTKVGETAADVGTVSTGEAGTKKASTEVGEAATDTGTVSTGETGTKKASAEATEAAVTPAGETEGGEDAVTSDTAVEDGSYDPSFEQLIEAETAETTGKVKTESTKHGFSGTGYLIGIEGPSDTVTFTVGVPGNGAYDLNFISASYSGYKENNVLVDGEAIGVAKVEGEDFTDSVLVRAYLTAGEHRITMTKSWGWIYLDALKVTASAPADETIYEVSSGLVDPEATDRTKRLMQYLTDVYGDYILSGQYGDRGIDGSEFKAIHNLTGEYPAILGLDFIEYTPSRVAHGSVGKDVVYAKKFDEAGGIVTFCWHWNAPEPYLPDTGSQPWWSGFYTKAATIDLKKIMNGEDPEGYELLLRDIDAIAEQLKLLQEADIPILWRPLHEASGGWFWWGASGPEAYIKLYQLLFDRLVHYHDIHNLIWVWNGQNKDWYPGDGYVDIVGTDIYPGERVYSSQVSRFNELAEWNGDSKRIIALTENGCLFDPDLAFRDNAKWAYFGTWEGEFLVLNGTYTISEKYTRKDMIKKVYTHDKVITLDELPNLKTYGQ
jgi:mannan endo-1,4-beta-mannosidase